MAACLTRVKSGGGVEPAWGNLCHPWSEDSWAGQGLFLVVPVDAADVPGSRKSTSNACHRVKNVSISARSNGRLGGWVSSGAEHLEVGVTAWDGCVRAVMERCM